MNSELEKVWKKSGFEIPKVLRAINPKTKDEYLVIEDRGTIIKLMDNSGNFYLVAAFRCSNRDGYYYINSDPIHPISCSKLKDPKDIFASNSLKSL